LVYHRQTGKIEHRIFKDIIEYLRQGDCLVINDTRVIPARLLGRHADTGGKIEFVLLNQIQDNRWEVLVKPGKRARIGSVFLFGDGLLRAVVLDRTREGGRVVEFQYEGIFNEVLDRVGIVPLPPYIHRQIDDPERYQTVYARYRGSVAAPTAGLHFTVPLLERIQASGVQIVRITLHVGLGTFRPVKVTNVEQHQMHHEYYQITDAAARVINDTKDKGGRVIAVGTTSTRALESSAGQDGRVTPTEQGCTDLFIYPGYKFKVIDALITNFHLPKSTLLMLVSAMCSREEILRVYQEAVKERYRFFSFGDAMLIL
jgi:S-adenosylmethionine:tRNA ribosyltransferase-isomerase